MKRTADEAITPIKEVTKRLKEGTDELTNLEVTERLESKIIKDQVVRIESYKMTLIEEFCVMYNLNVQGGSAKEIISDLMRKGYTDKDLTMTVNNESILLSDEIASFQRGKLEGIFQGRSTVAEITALSIDEDDLKDKDKVGEILTSTVANQAAIISAVTNDLNKVMKRLSVNEAGRVVSMLLASKLEAIVLGINLDNSTAKNGYEIGVECKKLLRAMAVKKDSTSLNQTCNKAMDIVDNVGIQRVGCLDRAEVRAMGREAKLDVRRNYKTIAVVLKFASEEEKKIVMDLLKDPSLVVRDSTPKKVNEQKAMIQSALKELDSFKHEGIWIRSDLVNVREGGEPSFLVKTKDSRNPDNKWTVVGNVPVRDPSIWGNLSVDIKKEHVYAETNVPMI